MIYLKLQTNRAKIKEIIREFSVDISPGEFFIAPRPLPKENFKFYIGFGRVDEGSKNHKMLMSIKNHSLLNESEYDEQVEKIVYSWKVPKNLNSSNKCSTCGIQGT